MAIAVGLNILREGVRLVWNSAQGLMDSALEPAVLSHIHEILHRLSQPEVRFGPVVTRVSGPRRFVELYVYVPAQWTLGQANVLRLAVDRALVGAVPGISPTVHARPHADPGIASA